MSTEIASTTLKVTKIFTNGGACPYQCEGELDNGDSFYLRYRDGRLRLYVSKDGRGLMDPDNQIFCEQIGPKLDGWPDDKKFKKHLDSIITFPAGFAFEY